MHNLREIVSADSQFKVEFFNRKDGSYGYVEFERKVGATEDTWQRHSNQLSFFASLEIAISEAEQRLGWLQREKQWPARECSPVCVNEYIPDWIKCPFCHIRFSLRDPARWGSNRHLTCGQEIYVGE